MKSGAEQVYLIRMGLVLLAEADVPLTRDFCIVVLDKALFYARAADGGHEARECNVHLVAITERLGEAQPEDQVSLIRNSG